MSSSVSLLPWSIVHPAPILSDQKLFLHTVLAQSYGEVDRRGFLPVEVGISLFNKQRMYLSRLLLRNLEPV